MTNICKKVFGIGIPLVISGLIIYGSQTDETETKILKYQGWYPDEGKNMVVFDSKPLRERDGKEPEYRIASDIERKKLRNLELNQNYKVKIEKKNLGFIFPDKVSSIEKNTTN
jgi:hypothetical protein